MYGLGKPSLLFWEELMSTHQNEGVFSTELDLQKSLSQGVGHWYQSWRTLEEDNFQSEILEHPVLMNALLLKTCCLTSNQSINQSMFTFKK